MNCCVYAGSAADRSVILVSAGCPLCHAACRVWWNGGVGWPLGGAAGSTRVDGLAWRWRPPSRPCPPSRPLPPPALLSSRPQKYDLFFPGGGRRDQRTVKPHVVLASYETVLKDHNLFSVRRCRAAAAACGAGFKPWSALPRLSLPPSGAAAHFASFPHTLFPRMCAGHQLGDSDY